MRERLGSDFSGRHIVDIGCRSRAYLDSSTWVWAGTIAAIDHADCLVHSFLFQLQFGSLLVNLGSAMFLEDEARVDWNMSEISSGASRTSSEGSGTRANLRHVPINTGLVF